MRTAAEIRGDFLLDPNVVFLNHGSFGATPHTADEDCDRLVEAMTTLV